MSRYLDQPHNTGPFFNMIKDPGITIDEWRAALFFWLWQTYGLLEAWKTRKWSLFATAVATDVLDAFLIAAESNASMVDYISTIQNESISALDGVLQDGWICFVPLFDPSKPLPSKQRKELSRFTHHMAPTEKRLKVKATKIGPVSHDITRVMSKKELEDALVCDKRTATKRLGEALQGEGQSWRVNLTLCGDTERKEIEKYLLKNIRRPINLRKVKQNTVHSSTK